VPRPHERKKAVIIGPAIIAQDERRAVIFRGGREHWPLTRTTAGRPGRFGARRTRHQLV